MLLDVSQTSQNFTRMIMERVLSKEEVEAYKVKMASRAELGRLLLEKGKKQFDDMTKQQTDKIDQVVKHKSDEIMQK